MAANACRAPCSCPSVSSSLSTIPSSSCFWMWTAASIFALSLPKPSLCSAKTSPTAKMNDLISSVAINLETTRAVLTVDAMVSDTPGTSRAIADSTGALTLHVTPLYALNSASIASIVAIAFPVFFRLVHAIMSPCHARHGSVHVRFTRVPNASCVFTSFRFFFHSTSRFPFPDHAVSFPSLTGTLSASFLIFDHVLLLSRGMLHRCHPKTCPRACGTDRCRRALFRRRRQPTMHTKKHDVEQEEDEDIVREKETIRVP